MLKIIFSMVVIALIILWLLIMRKSNKGSKSTVDTIIFFTDKEKAPDIRKDTQMMAVAEWKPYGENNYRGFCSLNKENLEALIIQIYGLKPEEFKLTYPSDLYMASTMFR